jgi:NADPH-dependent ferric siderophore reductase
MTTATAVATHEPDSDARMPQRVRHQPRRREVVVERIVKLTPHMIRVTFGGDLEGFTSLGFDDHVKVFLPGTEPGSDGEPKPISRDYTPRRYDPVANTLDIEFVLHDAGPATRWAEQAQVGQPLQIGGPRGSFIIPLTYDWHLLIGDDTGLPAIARRLAELPVGTSAVVLAEVEGPEDCVKFESDADVSVTWAYRNGAEPGTAEVLLQALQAMQMPKGDYYAWVACESLTAKALRAKLIAEHGANPKWMRCAGYWRRGAVAVHDNIND